MTHLPLTLAEGGNGVVAAIMISIWIGGAIISALKRKTPPTRQGPPTLERPSLGMSGEPPPPTYRPAALDELIGRRLPNPGAPPTLPRPVVTIRPTPLQRTSLPPMARLALPPRRVVQKKNAPPRPPGRPVVAPLPPQSGLLREASAVAQRPAPASPKDIADSTRPSIADSEIRSATTGPKEFSPGMTTLRISLSPESLRRQFILTEILRPPVTLRESGE